jgi:two-component system chemotaxis response regulator CheB
MQRIRILVVDDAVVFRRLLTEVLSGDPAIEVVGSAAHGRIALARIPQVNPDLVILDVEMPEMDGLTTLAEIRKLHPRLPVIMFSALTERGAAATLDALTLGAAAYVTKPSSADGLKASLQVLRAELIPHIKALCAGPLTPAGGPAANAPSGVATRAAVRPAQAAPRRVEVLALGTSTGGPNALTAILAELPADFPVPVVIVQHMPPMFTTILAERLAANCAIRVAEGVGGGELTPGKAWVAPGNFHMVLVRDGASVRLLLHQDSPVNSCRPAVDVLFSSVAQAYGAGSLGVVLTGMGNDGLRGCERIREAGGQVLVQDEATSVVWGMPGFVARAGLADQVLPLGDIGAEILRRVGPGRPGPATHQGTVMNPAMNPARGDGAVQP